MNVAIIGGTGFVGGYLVDALLEAGHAVSALVRTGSESKLRQAGRCRVTAGDLADRAAVRATVDACDAVIYNVGLLREFPSRGITFEGAHVEGVRCVIDAARDAGVRRFILMSANGVKAGGTPYQDTKFRAERLLEDAGFDATIFRPSVIFGDPRGTMEFATQLYGDLVKPPVPAPGFHSGWGATRGDLLMSPVHIEDVADAFVAALDDPATHGRTIALGGPEELSWTDMLGRVAAAVGRRKTILPMPLGIMKLGAAALDWLPFFPVTHGQLTMLEEGNTASPEELERLIARPARAFSADNLAYLQRA
jgi:NADH dehydrogenase